MKIFISYRRKDSEDLTGRIYDHLAARLGKENIFLDVEGIHGGEEWRIKLEAQIRGCDVLLAVIGEEWLDELRNRAEHEDMVKNEVRMALDSGTAVIPVPVGNAHMPRRADLPKEIQRLADFHSMPVRPGRDFRHDVERLADAIERLNPARDRSAKPLVSANAGRQKKIKWITATAVAGLLAILAAVSFLPGSKDSGNRSPLNEGKQKSGDVQDLQNPEEELSHSKISLAGGGSLEVSIQPLQEIGQRAELVMTATRDVFVRTMHLSSDGIVSELFPGTSGESGLIPAGAPRVVSWQTTPPAGGERIVVYASVEPIEESAADGAAIIEAMKKDIATPRKRGAPKSVESIQFPVLENIDTARISYQLSE